MQKVLGLLESDECVPHNYSPTCSQEWLPLGNRLLEAEYNPCRLEKPGAVPGFGLQVHTGKNNNMMLFKPVLY